MIDRSILEGSLPWPTGSGSQPACQCGWPYTLLVPNGAVNGMKFRLVALATPGEDIESGVLAAPNSTSYCGVEGGEYPDKRAMGYPFDRPFKMPIQDWLDNANKPQQLAAAIIEIEHI